MGGIGRGIFIVVLLNVYVYVCVCVCVCVCEIYRVVVVIEQGRERLDVRSLAAQGGCRTD